MKKIFIMAFALVATAIGTTTFAQGTKMAAGASMKSTIDIVDFAISSKNHTTLVAAVTAAGLVETLKSDGPFTVFAPTNDAFNKLPEGTVGTLVKPENKALLTKILTYHVLAGKFSAADIVKAIKAGKGTAEFTTVSGGKLSAMLQGSSVVLKDENGNMSTVTAADLNQKNGVIHVIDSVVLPK
jgi:uncharacterized surface protein with fasciclin (FAS1) repeats